MVSLICCGTLSETSTPSLVTELPLSDFLVLSSSEARWSYHGAPLTCSGLVALTVTESLLSSLMVVPLELHTKQWTFLMISFIIKNSITYSYIHDGICSVCLVISYMLVSTSVLCLWSSTIIAGQPYAWLSPNGNTTTLVLLDRAVPLIKAHTKSNNTEKLNYLSSSTACINLVGFMTAIKLSNHYACTNCLKK